MTLTATLVSPEAMADIRSRAAEHLVLVGDSSEYSMTRVAAVLAACDWLDGTTATAPVSGEPADPTRPEVYRESVRAFDAEDDALRRRERGTYPGVVGVALRWALGMGDAPI